MELIIVLIVFVILVLLFNYGAHRMDRINSQVRDMFKEEAKKQKKI